MLGYDDCFAVGSSGLSGGLGIYQNNEINVEFLPYSQYHIDARIHMATGQGSENDDLDEANKDPMVPSENGIVDKGRFLTESI
jgi:hypothetical protein